MSTTLNHVALSRAQFAQASELADAGSTELARTHLQFAADHALLALEKIGVAPPEEPVLRGHRVDIADFGRVQELIDNSMAHRAPAAPTLNIPLYGGPRGAMSARGAETAERGLKRIGAAIKGAFRR